MLIFDKKLSIWILTFVCENGRMSAVGDANMKIVNLSEKFVNIFVGNQSYQRVELEAVTKEKWEGNPIVSIECEPHWQYFALHLPNQKSVFCDRYSKVQLRKIEKGYFKNCFCVIEKGKSTTISILHKNGILIYPEFKKSFSLEKIDELFGDKNIETMVALLLNRFDVSRTYQTYQSFCENLPVSCWGNGDFKENVLEIYQRLGDVDLENVADENAINKEYCKNKSLKYFEGLSAKRMKTDELKKAM